VHTGCALRLVYHTDNVRRSGVHGTPCGVTIAVMYFGDQRIPVAEMERSYHEMAHVWDDRHGCSLGKDMADVMGASYRHGDDPATAKTDIENHGNFPTEYATKSPGEDFADSVEAYFQVNNLWAENRDWSDDDPRYQADEGIAADEKWSEDRYDYIEALFSQTW
jgi:hypothetical protein